MKNISFIVVLALATLFTNAQDNNFLIYSFKGNVSVIENKVESNAKIGKMLNKSASIKVPAGSVVTLICNEQSMFSIKKAGTYILSQFGDSCQVNNSSFTANYVKYVWNQMTKSGGSPGSDRKKFMNSVGAVSRSVNNVWIDPRLDTVNYAGGQFPLSWKSYAEAKEFEFSLYGENQTTPIFTTVVDKLKIQIPIFYSVLKPGQSYTWTAAVKGEQNEERKVFNYVSQEAFQKLVKDLKATAGTFESPAEEAYRIGFMLEDAHYLSEAHHYYSQATVLAPDVALYRSTLMSFRKDYEIKVGRE